MCFSAPISFLSSALLTTIGIYSLMKMPDRRFTLFAAIPILFGLQQLSEGFVWLGIAPHLTSSIFLTFALLIWPIWMSPALYMLERSQWHKQILLITGGLGLIWSGTLLYLLLTYGAVVNAQCAHIYYALNIPWHLPTPLSIMCYYIPTILPFILSSYRALRLFGFLCTLFIGITLFFWHHFFISVWCFFSAILSLMVYHAIMHLHRH